jgi:GntR family transcriptional repressor for pyruvate dehydrogenase complex
MRYNGSAIGMGDGMDSEYATSDGARLSVTDRVVAEILRLIAAGDIVPGDNLPAERKLAEMLGVSRVSVRAALQTLKAQGFLTAVQGGGTRVVSSAAEPDPALAELVKLDRSNMRDLMDLRCEIEVWAARRAARHASEASLSELRAAFGDCEAGGADKAAADVAFHMAVAKASDSPVYRHVLGVIRGTLAEMLTYHRTELFGAPEDDATVVAHHRAIVEAIESRDEDRAAEAMRRHLVWAREHYTRKSAH